MYAFSFLYRVSPTKKQGNTCKHWKHDPSRHREPGSPLLAQPREKLNWSLTCEFLLLLFTHPVDSEAGCSSQPTPENFLMGLGLPVSEHPRVLCKNKNTKTQRYRGYNSSSLGLNQYITNVHAHVLQCIILYILYLFISLMHPKFYFL